MKYIENCLWGLVGLFGIAAYGVYDDSHLQADALALVSCLLGVVAFTLSWRSAGRTS